MDSAWTVGEVAERLGVTPPTVLRAVRRLGLEPARTAGGHRRFDADEVADHLVSELGIVPTLRGLSRESVQVLAGLSRHPLGLSSVRAVARASCVSATTASRLLPRLVDEGLVVESTRRVAHGRAADVHLFEIAWASPKWQAVAGQVGRVVLPSRPGNRSTRAVPRRLAHLFWNADFDAVDPDRDARYVAGRLLLSDDTQAVAWAVAHLPAEALLAAGALRHATAEHRSLAMNAAAAADR